MTLVKAPNSFCVRSAEPEKFCKHPKWVLKRWSLCRLVLRPSTSKPQEEDNEVVK